MVRKAQIQTKTVWRTIPTEVFGLLILNNKIINNQYKFHYLQSTQNRHSLNCIGMDISTLITAWLLNNS